MKVKDLRDYLNFHDISTETCGEKEELVFLVLRPQSVGSQEGRTRAPAFSSGFLEQQAFLTQPHSSLVPPTSPGLLTPATQATLAPAQPRLRKIGRSMAMCLRTKENPSTWRAQPEHLLRTRPSPWTQRTAPSQARGPPCLT